MHALGFTSEEGILLALGSFTDSWEGQGRFVSRRDSRTESRQKGAPQAEELKIPKYSEAIELELTSRTYTLSSSPLCFQFVALEPQDQFLWLGAKLTASPFSQWSLAEGKSWNAKGRQMSSTQILTFENHLSSGLRVLIWTGSPVWFVLKPPRQETVITLCLCNAELAVNFQIINNSNSLQKPGNT